MRKLEFNVYGEMGRNLTEYYFDGRGLYFVHLVFEQYDGLLSGVVIDRSEDRLYFDGGALHLWLRGKETVSPSKSERAAKAREVTEDARNLLAGAGMLANELRCVNQEPLRLVESTPSPR